MPDINLIRGQRVAERRSASLIRQLYIAGLIAFAAGALGFSVLAARGAVLKGEIKAVEAQITIQAPTVEKIEQCRNEAEALEPKLALLGDCREEITSWHAICCSLSQRLAPQTWLTSLDIEEGRGQGASAETRLKIDGVAFTHTRVGETMLALNTVPEFQRVELESTKRIEIEDAKALEFRLDATLPQRGVKGQSTESGTGTSASSTG